MEWAAAALALGGAKDSGDAYLVEAVPNGCLLAVVDGLGHGPIAAVAARAAIATLQAHALEAPIQLLNRCHSALQQTRGVALSLALINADANTLTWLGVGNVECLLLRADPRITPAHETIVQRGGVVGYQLPSVQVSTVAIGLGDLLIFATDGIRSGFAEKINLNEAVPSLADRILAQSGRGTDDALVLVARYRGKQP